MARASSGNRIKVKVVGADELRNQLDRLSDEAQHEAWEILREEAAAAAEEAKRICPKRPGSGRLASTIRVQEGKGAMQVFVTAGNTSYPIAHLVEYGHAKKGGGMVAARPFMTPVGEAARPRAIARLKDLLWKNLYGLRAEKPK
jgi:hypothetical protein